MYYLYKHENIYNHKTYIGCSTNPVKRWRNGRGYENQKEFFSDIQKYGWNSFDHKILLQVKDADFATALETALINEYHPEYNTNYSSNNCLRRQNTKHSKPVLQLDLQGNLVAEFPSAAEADRSTGIKYSSISQCCSGLRKTAGGYAWKFKGEN